jgi:hypothetical protein
VANRSRGPAPAHDCSPSNPIAECQRPGLPLVGESDRGPSVDAGSRGVQSATARDVATICGQRVERKQRLEPRDATAGDQHA